MAGKRLCFQNMHTAFFCCKAVDSFQQREVFLLKIFTTVAETVAYAKEQKAAGKTIGLCPSWHYGVGYPAWFFLDEVEVE